MGDQVVTKHRKVHLKPDDRGTDGEAEVTTVNDKQDASVINGSRNEDLSHVQSNSAKSYADDHAPEVDINSSSHNTDSLQELLQLAQEFEALDPHKRDSDKGRHLQNEGFSTISSKEEVNENACVQEDVKRVSNEKEGMEGLHPEGAGLRSIASIKGVSAPLSFDMSETASAGDKRIFPNKEVCDTGQSHASENRRSARSSSFSSITVGPSRSQFTIPQPFSLATDRRAAQSWGRPRDDGGQMLHKPRGFDGATYDSHLRSTGGLRKVGTKGPVSQSQHSDSSNRHPDEPLKRTTNHTKFEHRDDDDTMSISSIRSCSQTPKAKASRFTNASSFNFSSDARAERRKEYYLKLQERTSAKDEEMKRLQAKAKKEREEEIKQLRKSMTFRAHPVPNFYQEGPPPKAELPKTPPTRAKSPNFTKRDSHSGSSSSRLCNALRCETKLRSSLSPQTQRSGMVGNGDQSKGFDGERLFAESPCDKLAECHTCSSSGADALELVDADNGVRGDGASEEVHAKVRDPLIISSDLMLSDEEVEKPCDVQCAESLHASSNGKEDKIYVDKVTCTEEGATVNGSFGKPKDSIVLKRHNVNTGVVPSSYYGTKGGIIR